MIINKQISELRKKEGITQEELAGRLGVTNQSVSKWESGQCCPDIALLPDIAAVFRVSVDELLTGKASEDPTLQDVLEDDKTIRVLQFKGRKLLRADTSDGAGNDGAPPICIELSKDNKANVEIFGNLNCKSLSCANLKCGDIKTDGGIACANVTCKALDCNGAIACGNVDAGNDLTCGDLACGNVTAGKDITCRDLTCGDITCKTFSANPQGSIVTGKILRKPEKA